MSSQDAKSRQDAKDLSAEEMLARILAAVEPTQRKEWAEVTSAVILSLATLASVWCAYQSTLWGGVQNTAVATTLEASQQAAEKRLYAGETRVAEIAVVLRIVEAKMEGKDRLVDFLSSRLLPETKAALDAWWATDPFESPKAPRTPFQMPQYKAPALDEAAQHDQRSQESHALSQKANQNSDTYVLLTVLFASVLFFGGIAGTFDSPRLRRVVLGVAAFLFLATFAVLVTMPIRWS